MRKFRLVAIAAILVVALLALVGCGPTEEKKTDEGAKSGASKLSGSLNIQGSDTMVNLAQAWAQEFMGENPDVEIAVLGGGSGTGIKALIEGTVDFADASREMKPEEIEQAKAKGIEPVEIKVARDGISIVVNPENKIADITAEQLGKVYRGEITNWKDLGGADAPISIVSRDPSSGTYEFFKEEIVGKEKNFAKSAKLLASTQAILDEVKSDKNAIGYVGVGYAEKATGITVISLDGKKPSTAAVQDGSYTLARFLYMYSNGEPKDAGKAYVDWIVGPVGQKIVEDQGYVSLQ